MKGQHLQSVFSLMITLLCLGSLMTIFIWNKFDDSNMEPHRPPHQKKSAPKSSDLCTGCKEIIDKVAKCYSQTWKKQEENYHRLRLQLSIHCNGSNNAILTQENTPVGSKIFYDGDKKRTFQVTPKVFKTFAKDHPFSNKIWNTCSVVGNSGILVDSGCGKMIDSAEFVIRCNLPPLENEFKNDVGMKTDLVTANPSILFDKYGSLLGRRREFVDGLHKYGNSLLLLPAFSFSRNTPLCERAVYAIEEFNSPIRPIFFNPQYLDRLDQFWHSRGLKERRLSTGLMMASLALEFCDSVDLYGFWPFSNHLYGLYTLTNHYFDDRPVNKRAHTMPEEFDRFCSCIVRGYSGFTWENVKQMKNSSQGQMTAHKQSAFPITLR